MQRLWPSVAFAVISTGSGGVVVGLIAGNGSCQHWLYSFGGVAELCGLFQVAFPELERPMRKAMARAKGIAVRIEVLVRAVLRRPRHGIARLGRGGASARGEVSGSAIVSISDGASLAQKVEFLLGREQITQERLNTVGRRLDDLPSEWRRDLEALRSEIDASLEEALTALKDEHLHVRRVGVVTLLVGIVLATWGNLL